MDKIKSYILTSIIIAFIVIIILILLFIFPEYSKYLTNIISSLVLITTSLNLLFLTHSKCNIIEKNKYSIGSFELSEKDNIILGSFEFNKNEKKNIKTIIDFYKSKSINKESITENQLNQLFKDNNINFIKTIDQNDPVELLSKLLDNDNYEKMVLEQFDDYSKYQNLDYIIKFNGAYDNSNNNNFIDDILKKNINHQIINIIVYIRSSENSGHYINFAKTIEGWYLCDDKSIVKKEIKNVKELINTYSSPNKIYRIALLQRKDIALLPASNLIWNIPTLVNNCYSNSLMQFLNNSNILEENKNINNNIDDFYKKELNKLNMGKLATEKSITTHTNKINTLQNEISDINKSNKELIELYTLLIDSEKNLLYSESDLNNIKDQIVFLNNLKSIVDNSSPISDANIQKLISDYKKDEIINSNKTINTKSISKKLIKYNKQINTLKNKLDKNDKKIILDDIKKAIQNEIKKYKDEFDDKFLINKNIINKKQKLDSYASKMGKLMFNNIQEYINNINKNIQFNIDYNKNEKQMDIIDEYIRELTSLLNNDKELLKINNVHNYLKITYDSIEQKINSDLNDLIKKENKSLNELKEILNKLLPYQLQIIFVIQNYQKYDNFVKNLKNNKNYLNTHIKSLQNDLINYIKLSNDGNNIIYDFYIKLNNLLQNIKNDLDDNINIAENEDIFDIIKPFYDDFSIITNNTNTDITDEIKRINGIYQLLKEELDIEFNSFNEPNIKQEIDDMLNELKQEQQNISNTSKKYKDIEIIKDIYSIISYYSGKISQVNNEIKDIINEIEKQKNFIKYPKDPNYKTQISNIFKELINYETQIGRSGYFQELIFNCIQILYYNGIIDNINTFPPRDQNYLTFTLNKYKQIVSDNINNLKQIQLSKNPNDHAKVFNIKFERNKKRNKKWETSLPVYEISETKINEYYANENIKNNLIQESKKSVSNHISQNTPFDKYENILVQINLDK